METGGGPAGFARLVISAEQREAVVASSSTWIHRLRWWDAEEAEEFVCRAREAVMQVLDASQEEILRRFGSEGEGDATKPSVLLIQGCGVDDELPETTAVQAHVAALLEASSSPHPTKEYVFTGKVSQVTEVWCIGCMAYFTEEFKHLSFRRPKGAGKSFIAAERHSLVGLNQVVPLAGKEEFDTNFGSKNSLKLHRDGGSDCTGQIDDSFLPKMVALFCLRPDHERVAKTVICDNRQLMRHMQAVFPKELETLQNENIFFKMREEERFIMQKSNVNDSVYFPRPHPCINASETNNQWPIISIQQNRPVDESRTASNVASAYECLCEAAQDVSYSICLDAGDCLVVNNSGCCHGRSTFTPRFDGADRWLHRLNVYSSRVVPNPPHDINNNNVIVVE